VDRDSAVTISVLITINLMETLNSLDETTEKWSSYHQDLARMTTSPNGRSGIRSATIYIQKNVLCLQT
jgi:hypothetical protein